MGVVISEVGTTDYHTAGEPFRIVTSGGPDISGATVLDRRAAAQASAEIDDFRQLLVREPRGHPDMYGCFLVPPNDDGAHFGVLFWHKDGYSTACGHGTIALGAWAVNTGRVPCEQDGVADVVIDVPSGRVTARVTRRAGKVASVAFRNVDAYVVARDLPVETSRGPVAVDLSFGGALYACVSAAKLGLAVDPKSYAELRAIGREVKWALNDSVWAAHPHDDRLSGVYGTVIYDDLGDTADGPHQRNITVFADGEVDRSPCGSGTSARLALLVEQGCIKPGETLRHDSVIGTRFTGRVLGLTTAGPRPAIQTEVEGMAYQTAEAVFSLDPDDPLGTGFLLQS